MNDEPLVSTLAAVQRAKDKQELAIAEAKWCLREIEFCHKREAEMLKRLRELDNGAEPSENNPHTGESFIGGDRRRR